MEIPNTYFLIFEMLIYIQLAICVRHAIKQHYSYLLRILFGIIFGIALEIATIHQLQAYRYGQFFIMLFDVPLCIGVAWSCIIYSAMEFSDASSTPYWFRPILDGLLGLNIDLALDAVAIRFGFWDWGRGLEAEYFGVPYGNFWAWFWVVFSFSLGYRIFNRKKGWAGNFVAAFSALVIGLVGVILTNAFIKFAVPSEIRPTVVLVTLSVALLISFQKCSGLYNQQVPAVALWVPFLMHIFTLLAGLISGVILEPIYLFIIGLLMFAISIQLHWRIFVNLTRKFVFRI